MVDIYMVRHGGCLVPAEPQGAEVLAGLDDQKPIKCNVRNPKEKRRDILNRLSHAIYREAAKQIQHGDESSEKAFCKYHYGIPILIHDPDDGEECRDYYERLFRGVPYEERIARMYESHKFYTPVTSLMDDGQLLRYVRRCVQHYAEDHGVIILTPKERQWLEDPEMQRTTEE